MNMNELAQQFRAEIMESGIVLDREGTHHEFVSGMHGQKLDFDNIQVNSSLYEKWIDVNSSFIEEEFPRLPQVIIGVANGTNRVALDVARSFNGRSIGLVSEKDKTHSKRLFLNPFVAGRLLDTMKPQLVVVVEDVGTTGSNSVQIASRVRDFTGGHVEVVTTWQRRENLERLDEEDIPYRAIIKEPLPTYSPEECVKTGFCSKDWEFIPRSK